MARQRDGLPRLNIPPSLNMQQPMGHAMFSPALPTTLQQSFHPPFPVPNSLQTPMQAFFTPQPPPAPGRPTHHPNQASIAHLAAAGIHPPNGFITPVSGHFPRGSLALGPGQHFPPVNRHRKQLSIARKLSPLPAVSPAPSGKQKKIAVNLPKETIPGEHDQPATRQSWARIPLQGPMEEPQVSPVKAASAESYPPEEWRRYIPYTLEVYLPGKLAWDDMRKQTIEEKLEKLGVERGSGSTVPHIFAPHARAASISSPADPALLLFKLNKLHQSQEASSAGNSLSTSPQPPFGRLSTSPHVPAPRFMNRHGQTMSLSQPPTYQSSGYDAIGSTFNPFGFNDASDAEYQPPVPIPPQEAIHAPQGRVPVSLSSLAPPTSASRPDSRPDFIRGFGLDIPEEEEPEEEVFRPLEAENKVNNGSGTQDTETGEVSGDEIIEMGKVTVPQSRHHSRHVSKLSAAMSQRSVNRLGEEEIGANVHAQREEHQHVDEERIQENHMTVDQGNEDMDLEDVVGEWTGSEDVYLGADSSDDESIGEWSNPSDEERARQERVERRMRRRAAAQQAILDKPRRLPNFPRPPEGTVPVQSQRDDDIISNPSDEGLMLNNRGEYLGVPAGDYYTSPELSEFVHHLPPLPHSRVPSGQYSAHDPAYAHSRGPSDHFVYPGSGHHSAHHSQHLSMNRRESVTLNPFAKPFVFGAPAEPPYMSHTSHTSQTSQTWQPFVGQGTLPNAPITTHSRLPSFGKPLNVAAPEFKPTGFTFRPPAAAPSMPQSGLASVPPPPAPAQEQTSPFKVQGREKRQRRGSTASLEEGDSMTSFRFPPGDSPKSIRRSTSFNEARHMLNPSAEPFTFAGFSEVAKSMPHVPKEFDASEDAFYDSSEDEEAEEIAKEESTAKAENGEVALDPFTLPSTNKPKRAPIPLDFKNPSGNTVPAGLFKALVNGGDERTRRQVRSRLSSREIFEHLHRPSMDDINMPHIAHKISRTRLVTDPGVRPDSPLEGIDDVFGNNSRHSRRRSSLPDALRDDDAISTSTRLSAAPLDLTTRMEMHKLESTIGGLLDERFAVLRREISKQSNGQSINSSTEAMIADVVSLFRAQLQDSAARSLEDSQMDARGEMDFQLLKDIIDEGHKELMSVMRRELVDVVQPNPGKHTSAQDIVPVIEQIGDTTINAVLEAISEFSARQEGITRATPARERDALVDTLMSALLPAIASVRTDPIDYEFLTSQLSQAVKPHITQLIDLASDKRETAGLIVDRILPLLPNADAGIDTESIALKLTTEVRRAIAPIDAFEIKEQVADLVVERLDSRLAVRDKAFNIDSVASKVTDSVARLLEPVESIRENIDKLTGVNESIASQQVELSATHSQIVNAVSEIPLRLEAQFEALGAGQIDILSRLERPMGSTPSFPDDTITAVKSGVDDLLVRQKALSENTTTLQSIQKETNERLSGLPSAVSDLLKDMRIELVGVINSREISRKEIDELRKANSDYQIQLNKARGAHGQVRVEKDALNERLNVVESDRERLRAQVKESEAKVSAKSEEASVLEARNKELEEALAKALARLQSTDVTAHENQKQIEQLEKNNRELLAEKQALKSKTDSLELQVTFASRDKETATQSLEVLQKQYDRLQSQQSHWDDLRQASEKIEMLTNLIGQADNEELKELRRYRERTKALEGEHSAIQKRFKDLESRFQNSERAASAAKQSLAQAQQRSTEWERRAKEYEGQLELTQTKLEQAEQTHSQLEADYSLVKLQLDEREADSRLVQDQESKLRDQISTLEAKVMRLQTELETRVKPSPYRNITNTHPPPRPDSRASIFDARSVTPTKRLSSYTSTDRSETPPQPSVWDSMHAPTNVNKKSYAPQASIHAPRGVYPSLGHGTPKARASPYYSRASIPSPTPSNVSAAPTLGDDGWWS
ncbi:hypothetical protein BDQ17DRAFT_1340185 [Cyathus striatus]|nr:hypothetical protein BDQ17DRAFT_1340185 [Cyathus striatus]